MVVVRRRSPLEVHDFEALFREHAGGVYRTLYAFTAGRRTIAEEATAEAFARAVANADRVRDPVAWVYRAAFRIAVDELRWERRTPPEAAEEVEAVPADLGELVEALRELSPNQRAAIVLRYEADLSVGEIARRLGTSAATVRVHLHRGRNRLRELLGTEETEERNDA
jgi:RNA polymerase sigma-70 factor (ECF subfamily)